MNTKPFHVACEKCDKTFDRKDLLYRHTEEVYSTFNINLPAAIKKLKVNEKEWKCKMSDRKLPHLTELFKTRYNYETHLSILHQFIQGKTQSYKAYP